MYFFLEKQQKNYLNLLIKGELFPKNIFLFYIIFVQIGCTNKLKFNRMIN